MTTPSPCACHQVENENLAANRAEPRRAPRLGSRERWSRARSLSGNHIQTKSTFICGINGVGGGGGGMAHTSACHLTGSEDKTVALASSCLTACIMAVLVQRSKFISGLGATKLDVLIYSMLQQDDTQWNGWISPFLARSRSTLGLEFCIEHRKIKRLAKRPHQQEEDRKGSFPIFFPYLSCSERATWPKVQLTKRRVRMCLADQQFK